MSPTKLLPMRRELIGTLTAVLMAAGLGLAGCGSNAEDHANHQETSPAPAPAGKSTKADFHALNTGVPGAEKATGNAVLVRHGNGTTLTITLNGLPAGEKFMAHIHAQPCSVDNAGGHFKFDQNGPAQPPNEVHVALNADQSGAATGTTEADREVGPDAKSVVVHAGDKKMLCADF